MELKKRLFWYSKHCILQGLFTGLFTLQPAAWPMLSPAQPSPGWMQASVFTSPIWTRLESEVSHHHHSNCITCLLYFQTTTLTTADVHWKVSCTQPYSGSQPTMAHICQRTAKHECSIPHSALLWITANHSSHLSQDSQVQYPVLSLEMFTTAVGPLNSQ